MPGAISQSVKFLNVAIRSIHRDKFVSSIAINQTNFGYSVQIHRSQSVMNKKARLSLTNPRDASASVARVNPLTPTVAIWV